MSDINASLIHSFAVTSALAASERANTTLTATDAHAALFSLLTLCKGFDISRNGPDYTFEARCLYDIAAMAALTSKTDLDRGLARQSAYMWGEVCRLVARDLCREGESEDLVDAIAHAIGDSFKADQEIENWV